MAKASTKSVKAATTVLEFDQEKIKANEMIVAQESDQEILDRLSERFEILNDMTVAVKKGLVRAMIVSGPPGVGKSYGVERVLGMDTLFDTLGNRKPRYEVVKGNMSALGLYAKLYEYSDSKNVLIFDDCDTILYDDLSLNILKAALDSGEKRTLSWNTDSRMLRSEGIPDRFEYKGAAIFITNIKFDHVKSRNLKAHLDALESRCHYIDLQMDTPREKLLRIKQIVGEGMLQKYEFEEADKEEIIQFVDANKDKLRELSLRMVIKLADLKVSFPKNWQAMAKTTCFRRA